MFSLNDIHSASSYMYSVWSYLFGLISFTQNMISGVQPFYIRPHVPVDIIRVFLILDSPAESLKASQKSF